MILNIHDEWIIEEYVKMSFILIWLIPPINPIIADMKMEDSKLKLFMNDNIMNGAIFCHVRIIKHWGHSINNITCGNQKWRGATPAFAIKLKEITSSINWVKLNIEILEFKKIHIIKVVDATAWTKKYLMEASTERYNILLIRMGAILIKLISRPIQAENHDEEEIVIIDPMSKDGIKIKYFDLIKIKKKKIIYFYGWGMNPRAYLAYLFLLCIVWCVGTWIFEVWGNKLNY